MTDEQKIADLLDGEWHDEKPHHAGLTWPLVDRMQLMKMPPINRIRLLKAPEKADEQNKPVRSRDEQIDALAAQIFFGMRNHADGTSEALRHIEEAEARGEAKEREQNAIPQQGITQWRNGNFDAWKDCSRHPKANNSEENIKRRYPSAQFRKTYFQPPDVAVLEARIAELEETIRTLFDGQATLENRGLGEIPERCVLYDDERVASGKDPVFTATQAAKQIRVLIQEGE